MPGFDIENLLEFKPAWGWCQKCRALRANRDVFAFTEDSKSFTCKVCGVKYFLTERDTIFRLSQYIQNRVGSPLSQVDDIVEHGKRLALITRKVRTHYDDYSPLKALMESLVCARSFVHFTSFGITQLMIGVLKMAAHLVPIRGIVSGNVGEQIISEVTNYQNESPNLSIVFCESNGFRSLDTPHQKLVVIDGLLAFKGSANLTQTAWRSAAQGMDIIEVVSNVDEVINLHNRYFSPIWGKMSDLGEEIELSDLPF
jgi:hypothetical protein